MQRGLVRLKKWQENISEAWLLQVFPSIRRVFCITFGFYPGLSEADLASLHYMRFNPLFFLPSFYFFFVLCTDLVTSTALFTASNQHRCHFHWAVELSLFFFFFWNVQTKHRRLRIIVPNHWCSVILCNAKTKKNPHSMIFFCHERAVVFQVNFFFFIWLSARGLGSSFKKNPIFFICVCTKRHSFHLFDKFSSFKKKKTPPPIVTQSLCSKGAKSEVHLC